MQHERWFCKMKCFLSFNLALAVLTNFVVTGALLHYANSDGYILNSECLYWVKTFESVSLVFCDSEPKQFLIKNVMEQGVPASVIYNVLVDISFEISGNLDFMVIVDGISGEALKSCVSSFVLSNTFYYKTRIIICDVYGTANQTLKGLPPRVLPKDAEFLGDASALLLSGGDCWYLSPPYLPARKFLRASSCKENRISWVMPREDVLDLQGNTLDVVTFHRPISTIINDNETDPDKRYDGIEVNIFRLIARMMNFTWRVDELEDQLDKYGQFLDGKWEGGIMEEMTRPGGPEIGFATLWMSATQSPYIDYTLSWMKMELVFLVPRPTVVTASWNTLLRPLSPPVWLLIAFIMITFPLTVRTMFQLYLRLTHLPQKPEMSLVACYFYAWGTVTGGSWRFSAHPPLPLRPMFFAWSASLVLLCCCYTSNIAAELSLPTYTPTVDTIRQLVEHEFTWGRTQPEDDLGKLLDFQKYWHRRFADHFIVYHQSEQRSLILGGKFAYLAQSLDDTHYLVLEDDLGVDEAEALRVLGEPLRAYRCAIATRKHSPLLASIDRVTHRLFETGLAMFYKNDAVRRFQNYTLERIYQDDDTSGFNADVQVPLTLNTFRPVFYVLFIGWVFAALVFLGELYVR